MRSIILLIFIIAELASVNAQQVNKDKVPTPAQTELKRMFGNVENVKWVMKNKHDFQANFKVNNFKRAMLFDENGNWLETASEVKSTQLPEEVNQAYVSRFKDYQIKEVMKVEKSEGVFYDFVMLNNKETWTTIIAYYGEIMEIKLKSKKK